MSGCDVEGHFEFRAFEPEPELVRESWRVFEEITNISPYDAILDASIEQQDGGFVVAIDVHSSIGRFGVVTRSGDWESALASAETQVQKEIHDWKGHSLEGRGPHRMAA
jgi:hypothetical protein